MTITNNLISCFIACVFLLGCDDNDATTEPIAESGECFVGGCSNQLCADEPLTSTCEWRESYACYEGASCARQSNGNCGWTVTDELLVCLQHTGGALPLDCGGELGQNCPNDYYCDWLLEEQACGAGNQAGRCTAQPEACAEIYAPVCGCDDETYSSECHAALAGADVAHEGGCD